MKKVLIYQLLFDANEYVDEFNSLAIERHQIMAISPIKQECICTDFIIGPFAYDHLYNLIIDDTRKIKDVISFSIILE